MTASVCGNVRVLFAAAVVAALLNVPAQAVAQDAHAPATSPVEQAVAPQGGVADAATGEPVPAAGQESGAPEHVAGAEQGGDHGGAEHEGSGLVSLIAKLFNFALLVGTLVYFLRSPVGNYLTDRGQQVRQDLVLARQVRESATAELAGIDERLRALPAELDALRARGSEEIAAEEERIRRAAAVDRERLIDQARREIGAQLRIARRDLIREASELAIGVARTRLQASLTHEDQLRLMDRYVNEVGQRHD